MDLNLSPRTLTDPEAPTPRRRKRRWGPIAVLVLVLGVGGVVVAKFLTSALNYYCNVDEVNVKGNCSGDKQLRVQGVVDQGSRHQDGDATLFTISFNGKTLPVRYTGDVLPDKFQDCIPVVIRGQLRDGSFVGREIEVKHTNEYDKENKSRIDQANAEADACKQRKA